MIRTLAIAALAALATLAACGGATSSAPQTAQTAQTARPWPVPAGFRSETIPFPLDFAPSLAHRGVEHLRFAPGFFDPVAPGYWSYAFVWRLDDPAALAPDALAGELTTYFRGLVHAVDPTLDAQPVTVTATPDGARLALTAHMIDAFKTKQPVDLAGWAERRTCGAGALWVFVIAPPASTLRPQLDALAAQADCTTTPRR